MKRLLVTFAIVSLALPATALGKGPSEATISGGGGGGGDLTITGCCEPGSPAMNLAEQAGFFPAVFGQQPDPMLDRRPKGDLGPKYTITYTVPGPNNETWIPSRTRRPVRKSSRRTGPAAAGTRPAPS